jgi:hypothetical protein
MWFFHFKIFRKRKGQPRQYSLLSSKTIYYYNYLQPWRSRQQTMSNALGYAKLAPKTPVPSDIEVSQQIVKEVGLLPISELGKQYVCVGVAVVCSLFPCFATGIRFDEIELASGLELAPFQCP